jgi:orotidine-5'-phosphate decarboxylase
VQALLEAKQAKLVSTAVELEEQRERMRRGRFHLIHDQVREARMEIEKRVLRDLELHVNKARTAAQETAAAREEVLLSAVEDLVGHEVAAAVLKQLQGYEDVQLLAVLQLQEQQRQQQIEHEQPAEQTEAADAEMDARGSCALKFDAAASRPTTSQG